MQFFFDNLFPMSAVFSLLSLSKGVWKFWLLVNSLILQNLSLFGQIFWIKIRPIWAGRHKYFIRILTKYLIKISKPQENSYWGAFNNYGDRFCHFLTPAPHLVHVVIEWLLVTYNLINSRDILFIDASSNLIKTLRKIPVI